MSWQMKYFTVEMMKYARNDQTVGDQRIECNLLVKPSPGLGRIDSEAKTCAITGSRAKESIPQKKKKKKNIISIVFYCTKTASRIKTSIEVRAIRVNTSCLGNVKVSESMTLRQFSILGLLGCRYHFTDFTSQF
jgi:hypothetical protein